MDFSDYIVYVDESGDHSLQSIDEQYPVFVLSFCIFHKKHYTSDVVSSLQHFKFKHFGHDYIILHEHDIRKEKSVFRFKDRDTKNSFMSELGDIIQKSNFIVISCVIDKNKLKSRYSSPDNPYHIALGFCLERLYNFLNEKNQEIKRTHIIVENRGKKEDNELELEFRRICARNNFHKIDYPFDVVFVDKKSNSTGLQLADLTARPIGLNVIRPDQNNKAFNILKEKLYCKGGRKNCGNNFIGFGLKIFP